jgi:hypothetical protein
LFISNFFNNVVSDKEKIETCFITEISGFMAEQYNKSIKQLSYNKSNQDLVYDKFLKQCEGNACNIPKEDILKELDNVLKEESGEDITKEIKERIYSSEQYKQFNEVFSKVKFGLVYALVGIIFFLLVSIGLVFLMNKDLLRTFFELSAVGFLSSLFSVIYFKIFLSLQSYVLQEGSLGLNIEESMKEVILSILRCIFSDSLNYYFVIGLVMTVILLGLTALFYFLNRKGST